MERNVDKIKRLEHELGRYRKKVADQAKETEKLRRQVADADAGSREPHFAVDSMMGARNGPSGSSGSFGRPTCRRSAWYGAAGLWRSRSSRRTWRR